MSHPLEISDFAFCNPPLDAVHPRMVDLGLRVKFRHLRWFYQPTERPSTGVLRREEVSVRRSSVVPKGVKEEVELTTKSPLFSDDGNQETNFVGALTGSLK